ncbi:hypothetical protein BGX29_005525 [Mortierella sp. GBA35]|nr:hypothetical protein BGX29_005525 [Mortierella sp. GBA35]
MVVSPSTPSTPTPSAPASTTESIPDRLRVLIVGGGIGGLMLGLMLERASIDYVILERSSEIRPLGSAICLNGTVLRVFEQLGLLEDLHKLSKLSGRLHLVKEDTVTQGHIDLEHFRERYGYQSIVFGRPDLLKLLVSRIPPGKLVLGKRILSTARTEFGALVRCSDGSAYEGDVLVGADGAYSSVRQNMHKDLKDKKMLPRSDSKPLKFDQNCVVGITDALDPEKYPALAQESVELHGIIGNKAPYTIWLIPIPGNRFAWSIGGRILDSDAGKEDVRSFSFAEWWPEVATDVCDLVRDYVLPDLKTPYQDDGHYKDRKTNADMHHHDSDTVSLTESSCHSILSTEDSSLSNASTRGTREMKSATIHLPDNIPGLLPRRQTPTARPGTVGEIIDATPNDRISKVMLESKLFKTWYHERTVLIGDACHKVLPFAGQGAIQAILDCISLANALYDMDSISDENITKVFKRYTNERYPIAKNAVSGSSNFGKLLNVNGRLSDFIRTITFNRVPPWLLKMATDKLHLHRPQLTYLPMVPDRGSAKAAVQEYSPKYLAKLVKERQEALAASAIRHHHLQQNHHQVVPQQQQQNGHLSTVDGGSEPESRAEDISHPHHHHHHHHDTRPHNHHHHHHRSHHDNRSHHDPSTHSHHSDYASSSTSDERYDHHDHNERQHGHTDRTTRGERSSSGRKAHSRSRERRQELQFDYDFPSPPMVPNFSFYDHTKRRDSRTGSVPPPLPAQAHPHHPPVEYLHHHPEDKINHIIPTLRSPSGRSFSIGPHHQPHHPHQQQYQQHHHQQQGTNQSSRLALTKRNTIMSTSTRNTTTTSSIYSNTAPSSVSSSPSSSPAMQPMSVAYEPSQSYQLNPAQDDLHWSEGYHHHSSNNYNSSNDNSPVQNDSTNPPAPAPQRLPRLPRSPLRSTSTFEVESSPYRPIH